MDSDGIEWFGRLSGQFHLRFILQPVMAAIIGYRDGARDARTGAPPYFWNLVGAESGHRYRQLRDGWASIGKVFILAVILDCLFQYWVSGGVGIMGAAVIAAVLAIVPYLVFRGLVNRWKRRQLKTIRGSRSIE